MTLQFKCDGCGFLHPRDHYHKWQIGAVIIDYGYMTFYYCSWSCFNETSKPKQVLGENAYERNLKDTK